MSSGVPAGELRFGDRPSRDQYDAVVIGSGPNGLSAAITLASAGRSVLVVEAAETIGGGLRTAELTLPGFRHDVCASIHALGVLSPFFRSLPLERLGVEWLYPDAPVAHPLDGGFAVVGERSVEKTAEQLGDDRRAYEQLLGWLTEHADALFADALGPLRMPSHPWLMLQFGWLGMQSARRLARRRFATEAARAYFAGHAAHSVLPLEKRLSAAFGLMLAVSAHAGGWPVAAGGSQSVATALARHLVELGGELVTGWPVRRLSELPSAKAYLCDLSPRGVARIAADRLPAGFCRQLDRYRFGPAAWKIDWALDGPIPWEAEGCRRAGTVHVGGLFDEIAESERAAWRREPSQRPFVLVTQPSLFDPSRAPPGRHTAWGYCHVPNGFDGDWTEQIERQIERFAPGFRDRILARHVMRPRDLQAYNANYVGGDITGGVMDVWQLLTRPTARLVPYSTPASDVFICSASTPPGGGVHGMCGVFAARAALKTALRD